jgi:hypothetical protein
MAKGLHSLDDMNKQAEALKQRTKWFALDARARR